MTSGSGGGGGGWEGGVGGGEAWWIKAIKVFDSFTRKSTVLVGFLGFRWTVYIRISCSDLLYDVRRNFKLNESGRRKLGR